MTRKQYKKICNLSIEYGFCYCYLCGKPILEGQKWNFDHIIARSKGGSSEVYNLRPTHEDCNSAKADLSLAQFRAIQATKQR